MKVFAQEIEFFPEGPSDQDDNLKESEGVYTILLGS